MCLGFPGILVFAVTLPMVFPLQSGPHPTPTPNNTPSEHSPRHALMTVATTTIHIGAGSRLAHPSVPWPRLPTDVCLRYHPQRDLRGHQR